MSLQQTPKKKKIKVVEVINGMEKEVEKEVDDIGGDWGDRKAHTLINTHLVRLDGPEKVVGKAKYTHDIRLPGMLYGRVLRSPHASAKVKSIDISAAQALPGVKVVIPLYKEDKSLKYEGDPVAAVAAVTPEIADDAIHAIKVEYEKLPHAVTAYQAMQKSAPEVYEGRPNTRKGGQRGDANEVKEAFGKCKARVEGEFTTPIMHHLCLETHGAAVDFHGGASATVWASTQWTHSISEEAAKELGLKDKQAVTTICEYMGGGFGNKFGMQVAEAVACKLSKAANAPVKLMFNRMDEFLMSGNRSGSQIKVKLGADAEGNLLAIQADQIRLGGLGLGSQAGMPYIYKVATVNNSIASVHTHQDSSAAMRAPGHVQASFAMESILDDLAAKLNIDPLEIRKKNTDDPTYHRQLDRGAKEIGWNRRPKTPGSGPLVGAFKSCKRGMGCGMATWGGGGNAMCVVDVLIHGDGSLTAQVGSQDLGTGTRTYIAAIVSEEFGLPLSATTVNIGSSKYGMSNPSGGSTTVASLAPAVKDAAVNAKATLFERLAPVLKAKPHELIAKEGKIMVNGAPDRALTWKQACAALGRDGINARGNWNANLQGSGVHGVHFAEVEVDIETGAVRVVKMVAVQDCGLPLNRTAVESQLNGAMIQAIGYALFETSTLDPVTGNMVNANMDDYKVPQAFEIPEMIPIIDDGDERNVVIGMAEPAIIPGAGAIANAIYNATGVRVRSLPITPDKILRGLERLKRS